MKITNTPIQNLLIIELPLYQDARGCFFEWFQKEKFQKAGLAFEFVQDNFSRSQPGVIRGMHYQLPAQGKLVGVAAGSILDVAIDLRMKSTTFGKFFSIELNDQNGKLLWIPPGFAHGFCVLGSQAASVLYKTTSFYHGPGEGGIAWNDPDIAIPWPIQNPLVSEKDHKQASFKEYQTRAVF